MNALEVVLVGVALATDAFAVTVANCSCYKEQLTKKKELLMPILFAIFQMLMPLIGYFAGSLVYEFISKISGWLSSAVFYFLAIKIIIEFIKEQKEKDEKDSCKLKKLTFWALIVQGVATSIDALLVGVTMVGTLTFSIFLAIGLIGIVTFILVCIALYIGKSLGKLLGDYATIVCIFILLALATKNLISCLI